MLQTEGGQYSCASSVFLTSIFFLLFLSFLLLYSGFKP